MTSDGDGVKVHLSEDHPGALDPEYRERRNEIAPGARLASRAPLRRGLHRGRAGGVANRLPELHPKHDELAFREFLEAKAALDLPPTRCPAWTW